jgi:hypothetical protein
MQHGGNEGDMKLVMVNGVEHYSRSCRILTRRTNYDIETDVSINKKQSTGNAPPYIGLSGNRLT